MRRRTVLRIRLKKAGGLAIEGVPTRPDVFALQGNA